MVTRGALRLPGNYVLRDAHVVDAVMFILDADKIRIPGHGARDLVCRVQLSLLAYELTYDHALKDI